MKKIKKELKSKLKALRYKRGQVSKKVPCAEKRTCPLFQRPSFMVLLKNEKT